MELYVTGNASSSSLSSSSGSNSSSSSSASNASTSHSNSLRDLDELLMGGNDLDALPFEFGCDFGAAFEDKYLVPPLSTRMMSGGMGQEAGGFDILPPLSASLLSPSTDFRLSSSCSTPSPSLYLHCEQSHDRLKPVAPGRGSTAGSLHTLKRKCDAAFPIEAPAVTSKSLRDETPVDDAMAAGANKISEPIVSSLSSTSAKSTHIGRWTKKEHELFLEGLKLYGKSWKKISSLVVTRTLVQIRTHAQKYLQKQNKSAQKAFAAAAAAAATAAGGNAGANDNRSTNKVDRQQVQRFGQHLGDHVDAWGKGSGLVPISFPDPPSSSSSSSMLSLSRSSSPYILPALVKKEPGNNFSSMCKLDQLLQDEPPHYLSSPMDSSNGYYQSPMGPDDEFLQHPMYAQWSRADPHDTSSTAPQSSSASSSAGASSYFPAKRRRLDHLAPVPLSSHQQHHLVNPMEAMASSSSDAHHLGVYGLGSHMSSNVFGSGMDFTHHHHHQQQQLHTFAPGATAHYVDSSEFGAANSYGNWQLS